MKTTLGKIKSFEPDKLDWDKLCLVFGTEDNTEVTLLQILDNTGVLFAFWSLRCWDYIEYASLLADIVEHVATTMTVNFQRTKPSGMLWRQSESLRLATQQQMSW